MSAVRIQSLAAFKEPFLCKEYEFLARQFLFFQKKLRIKKLQISKGFELGSLLYLPRRQSRRLSTRPSQGSTIKLKFDAINK